ncbi:hypothetical protein N7468_003655 [Penicillium chermesinum]|uniref:Uncharacterized protein n=1 Tax=Penicillium chermesinum TaxID=63820 RepID=A0A9W9P7K5_9EURO|nr:uncharacterized protein N7468_003655 [Penicillium chermesinum]KAJ5239036.1 hypothetical protein N7468_003655 [Penicillium chermesinum]
MLPCAVSILLGKFNPLKHEMIVKRFGSTLHVPQSLLSPLRWRLCLLLATGLPRQCKLGTESKPLGSGLAIHSPGLSTFSPRRSGLPTAARPVHARGMFSLSQNN